MVAAAPLLRDWNWLQEQVIPPLLRSRGPRPARTWSIGSTADAVAVTVAFAHAAGARPDHQIGRASCRERVCAYV